jgi:choline dehydrogenase-like flavoprotein
MRPVKEAVIMYQDVKVAPERVHWDKVVDVVCIGAGPGALATAIVAVDAGLEVFVAESGGAEDANAGSLPRRLSTDVLDGDTIEYLDSLTQDLGPLSRPAWDVEAPVRVLAEPSQVELGRGAVETFFGARLGGWAAQCLASPYGVLYTAVSDRNMSPMRSRAGGTIEAAIIGSFELDPELPGSALADWMSAQAKERGIEVHAASPLRRLVFEDGQVVGAVLATPAGPCAIRGRRGVVLGTGGNVPACPPRHLPAGQTTMQVAVVSQTASRFGRLELLATASLAR